MKRNILIASVLVLSLFAFSCTKSNETTSIETPLAQPMMIQIEGISIDATSDLSPVILVR